ncbi:MAG: zinc-ribbon domain-containing protein [Deltaproteobacteria bacterium]|nr:zinc-ribbon domain-containing protein [Deltaproteobacteria bacterium]
MKTECPSCKSKGSIPDDKIPPGGANVNCPK